MSITRTRFLKIINADKDDDIPAGVKTELELPLNDLDNSGRNGDNQKIDEAIGLEHNPDGTHKAKVITGANLVQTGANATVDESTLEFSANKMRVKPGGITTTELAAGSVTSDELQDEFTTSGRQIYANNSEAGTSPGDTPAAALEWAEDSFSHVRKIRSFFRKVNADKKCKLVCGAKTTAGTWSVRLNAGSRLAAAIGTNTAYGDTPEVEIEVDISGLANDSVFEALIELALKTGASNASITTPVITITQD